MALGINVDPFGQADPAAVRASGASWVRLVLTANVDIVRIVQGYKAQGLKVLAVLAKESMETALPLVTGDWIGWYSQRVGGLVDVVQVGNESDHTSPSSWTMPLGALTQLGWLAHTRFPSHVPIMMGGLASGNPAYLDTHGGWLGVFDLLAVHPYTQNHATIINFLQGYRARAYGHPIWVTEFAWYDGIARPLTQRVPVSFVYTWQDWPGWSAGLHDQQGNRKPEYFQFQQLAKEVNRPMPQFVLGFKAYADAHPEVGQPLEDEQPLAGGYQSQMTTAGLLVYSKQANQVQFLKKE